MKSRKATCTHMKYTNARMAPKKPSWPGACNPALRQSRNPTLCPLSRRRLVSYRPKAAIGPISKNPPPRARTSDSRRLPSDRASSSLTAWRTRRQRSGSHGVQPTDRASRAPASSTAHRRQPARSLHRRSATAGCCFLQAAPREAGVKCFCAWRHRRSMSSKNSRMSHPPPLTHVKVRSYARDEYHRASSR